MSSFSRVLTGAAVLAVLAASGAAQAYTDPAFSAPGIANPGYPDFVSGVLNANLEAADLEWNANADGHGHGAFQLTIDQSAANVGVFNFPSGAYLVGSETIKLTANFDSKGNLLTGTGFNNSYEIDGSLPASNHPSFGTAPGGFSWGAQPVEKLFGVSLTSFGVDSTHEALGFNTNNFSGWANQQQFTGGSTAESLWLYALINTGNLYCVGPRQNNNCNNPPLQNGTFPFTTSNSAWNTFLSELKNHSQLKAASFFGIGEIATVPLPAAIWLLTGGLAALGGRFRRRSTELGSAVAA
jgi:hypothetical protein